MKHVLRLLPFAILMAAGLLVSGCQRATPKKTVTASGQQVMVEVTRVVEKVATKEVVKDPSGDIPFAARWVSSAHADTDAEAFNHWNEADPVAVPKSCARCHSADGYQDYLGADGSEAGVVDKDAPIGTVISCAACHNDQTLAMDSVEFPSGVTLSGYGASARCAVCHQGRASTVQVDDSIKAVGATDPDTVQPKLTFTNMHYMAAAAIQAGAAAQGGYQYQGQAYDVRFAHVEGMNQCADCHDPHTLKVQIETCGQCHTGVKTEEDLKAIRMQGSQADYDGDGDTQEGIYGEIQGLQTLLYQAMQAYGADVAGTALVYDADAHPYFFIDTNKNGQADGDEANSKNQYNAWTPRLVKAAYNYQLAVKNPGAFAHNAKYVIELLYDSIADLNQALKQPVDLSKAQRTDPGHFAGSNGAFRHWDSTGAVPGTCSKCHSADGLPFFLTEGVTASQKVANGFECTTCHSSLTQFTRYEVKTVTFPSGATVDSGNNDTNLCMTCHQGRSSTVTVDKAVAKLDADTVSDKLTFQNAHYFTAGATLFGTEAKGAYEYAGQTYVGRNEHVPAAANCTDCHAAHNGEIKVEKCAGCHTGVAKQEDLRTIRMESVDYDGDGDTKEGVAGEIQGLQQKLLGAIQAYAKNVAKTPIAYSEASHPYFFVDTNGNGTVDPDEANTKNQYNAWTPRLLKAAYNYQYVVKDPGAFAHNSQYILQVLYDSLQDLSSKGATNMAGLTRPK